MQASASLPQLPGTTKSVAKRATLNATEENERNQALSTAMPESQTNNYYQFGQSISSGSKLHNKQKSLFSGSSQTLLLDKESARSGVGVKSTHKVPDAQTKTISSQRNLLNSNARNLLFSNQ